MISVVCWKEMKKEDSSVACRLQVQYKDQRRVKTILKELAEWKETGNGYNPRNKESLLFFAREFPDDKKWRSFLKSFPYRIIEKTPTGKERVYNAKKII
tara:strand:- start:1072 stop:1368 length:297 start_codon:yes stop_codon:yes gene_type:complete